MKQYFLDGLGGIFVGGLLGYLAVHKSEDKTKIILAVTLGAVIGVVAQHGLLHKSDNTIETQKNVTPIQPNENKANP